MPVYSYKCNKCGKVFDISQASYSFTGAVCPMCKSNDVTRQVTNIAFFRINI